MAYSFGDGFDLYAAAADAITGYWDGGTTAFALTAGRFAGSRALNNTTTTSSALLFKNSGQNDAVHHIVVAFQQTAAISGSALSLAFNLADTATTQCSIVFRGDGAILLTSGGTTGTVLATYTGAVTASSTWYSFEFEVVINNTTGSFAVRKNGNSSNDFSATGLNTRGGTANNYANRVQIGVSTGSVANQLFDDFFWRSHASAVAWLGDIRCFTRMPASDASVQFARSTGSTNASCVDEAQQNGLTDYVFDATAGHADLYNVATIGSTPASVVAVTTRGYMQKSDAGTRTASVALKSGATTVNTATLTLSSSGWLWAWRMDLTDPASRGGVDGGRGRRSAGGSDSRLVTDVRNTQTAVEQWVTVNPPAQITQVAIEEWASVAVAGACAVWDGGTSTWDGGASEWDCDHARRQYSVTVNTG